MLEKPACAISRRAASIETAGTLFIDFALHDAGPGNTMGHLCAGRRRAADRRAKGLDSRA